MIVIAIDILWYHRARITGLPWTGLALSATTGLAVAGPWWLLSGRSALRYLRTTGYQASSGFAGGGGVQLSLSALLDRARWSLDDLGAVQSATLILAVAAGIAMLVSKRRTLGGVLLLGGWAAATFIVLATSRNSGTGFGLPVIVVLIILAGAKLPAHRALGALAIAVLIFGVAAEAGGRTSEWWFGPPYRVEAIRSTGTGHVPSFDNLERSVLTIIGQGPTLLARNDDALNGNGLSWFSTRQNVPGFKLLPLAFGPSALEAVGVDLLKAKFVITGSTPAAYPASVTPDSVKGMAAREGFRLRRIWHVSRENTVEVLQRG